jgi:hypothetical protein
MRFRLASSSSAAILAALALAGCDARNAGPLPAVHEVAPTVLTAAPPAVVVFTGSEGAVRTVGAALEDGSQAPVALSAAGVDTTFGGALPGRRALLVEHRADGSISAIVSVGVDGADRVALGALPPGQYADVTQIGAEDDAVVAQLAHVGTGVNDVVVLRGGAAPQVLADGASLSAAAYARVVVVADGNVETMRLDGGDRLLVGGADGGDKLADVQGDRLLVTLHAGAHTIVRVVGLDGGGEVDFAHEGADQTAVAFTAGGRIVYVRRTRAGGVMVSAASGGGGERVLSAPDLDASPITVTRDGQVFFASAQGGLYVAGADGGAPARLLDPAAGPDVQVGAVSAGRVVYTSGTTHWPALRSAALDGSGVAPLCEEVPAVPFFGGLTPDGRVVYYRSLAGQLEGGRVFSVKLDGGESRPVGLAVTAASGEALGEGPTDQDFEAITPSGRVILESEFEETGGGSQLLVGSASADAARFLSGATHVRYKALIP